MKPLTVLFADTPADLFSPIAEGKPKCLLPFGNKPLLVHALEDAALAGIKKVMIVCGRYRDEVFKVLGDGRRWGVELVEFEISGADRDFSRLSTLFRPLLLIQADVARSPAVDALLNLAEERPEGRLDARMEGQDAGITLFRKASGEASVDIQGGCDRLEDFAGYHGANLDILSGRFPGLLLEGRSLFEDSVDEMIVARGSRALPANLTQGRALIGAYSRLARDARLNGRVVLGNSTMVEAGTHVSESLVLPGTYVGPDLEMHRVIAAGRCLIQVDTGAVMSVNDPFLLANLDT